MGRVLDTQEFLDMICELLRQGQTHLSIPVTGGSMVPFLHSGDTVCLDLLDRPARRGDILLYQRQNGRYIPHRLIRVRKDGSMLMAGDAQQELEILPGPEHLRAIVTSAFHKGKRCAPGGVRWWIYANVWMWLLPVRHRLMWFREKLRRSC